VDRGHHLHSIAAGVCVLSGSGRLFAEGGGWELEKTLAVRLPLTALLRALAERKPRPGLVHHSARGLEYASSEYVNVLRQHQMIPCMSRPANPYDNASCESFILLIFACALRVIALYCSRSPFWCSSRSDSLSESVDKLL
jgi:transposase InsO family protein